MLILVTRCAGGIEPVYFEVTEGEVGIPIFDNVEDAEEFAEAYREQLGPGLDALELSDHAMAQLLNKCVDKAEYVILNPKPAWTSNHSVWWEMADLCQFAEGLHERGL
jgi:hypothetical protein